MNGFVAVVRLAMLADPILYTIFNSEIGRQFFILSLDLSVLGIQTIIPSFWVLERWPFQNPSFNEQRTKYPFFFPEKNLKNSTGNPSEPCLFSILHIF